jgi:autotransporter-associated beta strand protein
LTKTGASTQILSGTNTYTGVTTINAGTLQIGAGTDSGSIASSSGITNNATLVYNVGSGNRTYANVISGSGSLTQNSSGGNLTLSGTNTYTGVTTISAGTLSVGIIGNGAVAGNLGNATSAAGNLVFDGGTLQYTGLNATSDRAFTINAGKTATIDTANNISFAGATGAATTGALTKIGAGTLTLTGASTYTGTTNVNAGTLLLASGAALDSNSIQVSPGATLDVSALAGGLTIASGKRIGGDGTISGNLSLASGAQFVFTPGAILDVTGTVTLDNTFSIASLVNANGTAIDWSAVSESSYTLIGMTASSFSNIGNFGPGNSADLGGGKFAYFQNGSLDLMVVPEPGTWALLATGLTTMVVFRRRRSNG